MIFLFGGILRTKTVPSILKRLDAENASDTDQKPPIPVKIARPVIAPAVKNFIKLLMLHNYLPEELTAASVVSV